MDQDGTEEIDALTLWQSKGFPKALTGLPGPIDVIWSRWSGGVHVKSLQLVYNN
ncbi:hypothetical protein [Mariprofundus aestuarium]|uniref:hypothetical protein n=1 Tax=Mariprofundus aestuarium TaxID=1921086 RepID=UPI0012FE537B|nr:hypothetical protein [Mariprofundus aestuarium]